MSNRVLKPDQTYHACLVSLEGRLSENILPTNPAIVTKISKAKIDPKHGAAMLMANVGLPSFGKKQTGKVSKEIEKEVRSPINVQSFTNLILLHHLSCNGCIMNFGHSYHLLSPTQYIRKSLQDYLPNLLSISQG